MYFCIENISNLKSKSNGRKYRKAHQQNQPNGNSRF